MRNVPNALDRVSAAYMNSLSSIFLKCIGLPCSSHWSAIERFAILDMVSTKLPRVLMRVLTPETLSMNIIYAHFQMSDPLVADSGSALPSLRPNAPIRLVRKVVKPSVRTEEAFLKSSEFIGLYTGFPSLS